MPRDSGGTPDPAPLGASLEEMYGQGFLSARERDILLALAVGQGADPLASTLAARPGSPGVPVDEPHPDSAIWRDSRYAYIREVGKGGMGRVWAAWDRVMAREVALKELLPDPASSGSSEVDTQEARQRALSRFVREARVTGRLQHPAIVPVHEIGARPDGTPFYTMRFVRGSTLHDAIAEADGLRERLALLPHYISACQAVAYAHANHVIHRDIKPGNILIGEFGETLVIDWGLAKVLGREDGSAAADLDLDEVEDDSNLTRDGQLLGTPHFMAPEQAAGRHDDLDARSDVYALGAVLYQLISGTRPFGPLSQIEVLRRLNRESPPPPESLCPGIPPALVAICRRAMALNPRDRYVDAVALAEEVERFLSGAVVSAHDYGLGGHLRRLLQRHKQAAVTAAVSALLLVGVTVYAFLSVQERADGERRARLAAERTTYGMGIHVAHRELAAMNFGTAEAVVRHLPESERGWEWGHLYYTLSTKWQYIARHGDAWGHGPDYSNVDLAADGDRVLTADDSGCIFLWSLSDNRALYTMQTHEAKLLDVKIHPDGDLFASSAQDGEVCVWDLAGATRVTTFSLQGEPREIAFSPDGDFLLAAGPGYVVEWDWRNGRLANTYYGDGEQLNTVDISASGDRVAAGDEIGMLYQWDRPSGRRLVSHMAHPRDSNGEYFGVLDVSFRPGHEELASSGSDGTVNLWDNLGALDDSIGGLGSKVWSVNWYPDAERMVTLDRSGTATILLPDSRVPPLGRMAAGGSQEVEIAPDGTRLLIASVLGNIAVVRPEFNGGQIVRGHRSGVNDIVFSRDSRWLYSVAGSESGAYDTRLLAWPINSHAHVPLWRSETSFQGVAVTSDQGDAAPRVIFDGLQRRGNCLSLHPDGALLAVGDGGGTVRLFDLASGALRTEIHIAGWGSGIRAIAFSPDGLELAVAGWGDDPGKHVKIYHVASMTLLREIGLHERDITHLAYAPDGRYLATGARDEDLSLWRPGDGGLVGRFEGRYYSRDVYPFAIAPNGNTILLPRTDAGIQAFHLDRDDYLGREYRGVTSVTTSVALNPDGTCIAATTRNETGVWDARTGILYFLLPHPASRVRFSPDGRTLATAGLDGTIGIWHSLPWSRDMAGGAR